jgi:hypothetical protein
MSVKSSRKTVQTQESDFSELLRDGLSSSKSYVVLKQKNRSPIYLAFKPYISRLTPKVIYVGGKLSAFQDKTQAVWDTLPYEEQQELLVKSFPKLPKDRVNPHRVGSNAGIFVAIGDANEEVANKIVFKNIVKALLDGIEAELSIEIENRIDVTKFLISRYTQDFPSVFESGEGVVASRNIGRKSGVVFGQWYWNAPQRQEFEDKYNLAD